jgi:adenylate cyclase
MSRIQRNKIVFLVCFWVGCTVFIVCYDAAVGGFESHLQGGNYSFIRNLLIAVAATLVGAPLLGSAEVLWLEKTWRRQPFGRALLFKSLVFLVFIFFFTSATIILIYSSELQLPFYSHDVLRQYYYGYLLEPRVIMSIIYWGIACMSALFILQVSEKFGPGVLVSFLLGRYHRPKEDTRIFMFMDLKSSTTYAEKLGHLKYSRFLQDCFYDITDVVARHKAEIYQYVGDEVVLDWNIREGIEHGNCIRTYFAYKTLLKSKEAYYRDTYGVLPEFKAGLNSGKVMVAEVGVLKKELAYHGDAINIASRIQEKCNDFRKSLLVSEATKQHLEGNRSLQFNWVGHILLKGKSEPVNIYDVQSA